MDKIILVFIFEGKCSRRIEILKNWNVAGVDWQKQHSSSTLQYSLHRRAML